MSAAFREVEGSEDLARELEEPGGADNQQKVYVVVEHATAGLGRGHHEWPQGLETKRQCQGIHAQCRHCLSGAFMDDLGHARGGGGQKREACGLAY
eukprot:6943986-Pyramimonas_sp.AAC.1